MCVWVGGVGCRGKGRQLAGVSAILLRWEQIDKILNGNSTTWRWVRYKMTKRWLARARIIHSSKFARVFHNHSWEILKEFLEFLAIYRKMLLSSLSSPLSSPHTRRNVLRRKTEKIRLGEATEGGMGEVWGTVSKKCCPIPEFLSPAMIIIIHLLLSDIVKMTEIQK